MSSHNRRSRVIIAVGVVLGVFFLYTFWPRALQVDISIAEKGLIRETVNEEAKTRMREIYTVSAPISGRLLRIEREPGDYIAGPETILGLMVAADPAVLDVRSEEQARSAVTGAEAALALASADYARARAAADMALSDLDRTRTLFQSNTVSEAALEQAEMMWRTTAAAVKTAEAAIDMQRASLNSAKVQLMTFEDSRKVALTTNPHPAETIPIRSPVSGPILRILQESETTLGAGTPILEIADEESGLEVVSELLSSDAVTVMPGDSVVIDNWGGGAPLDGVVDKIEPWGFTKYSALGVEEQRVKAIIRLTGSPEHYARLGHAFRVDVRIVTWENPDALIIPSNALFRQNGNWAVFSVMRNRAALTIVEVGRNNGVDAEILSGLEEGDSVIMYPGSLLQDGHRVKQRKLP